MTSDNQTKKKTIKIISGILLAAAVIAFYVSGVFYTMISGYGLTGNPFKIIACVFTMGFPVKMFIAIFLILGACFIVAGFQVLSELGEMDKLGRKFRQPKNRQTYGDAHFEEPDEYKDLANITPIEKAKGTLLGQLTDKGDKCIEFRTDNTRVNSHMAVIGASGSGKSFTFSNNYVYQAAARRESIVITDPDGGLQRQLGGFLINQGYIVKSLNLKDLDKSNGWNCLASLNSGKISTKALIFANTVISNVADANADSIYKTGPESLLRALILRVFQCSDFPPESKTIKTVYSLLLQPNIETFLDNLFDESILKPDERECLGPWRAFLTTSKNLKGNLIANLAIMLQILQARDVSDLLSTDDIDLELPGDEPCAYFCQFPDSHDTYQFVEALFFSMLFQTLIDKADSAPGGKTKIPVNFLMDEFPSIGILPDWDRKMSTIRKRNLNVVMICQDLTQLQNNYEQTWVTLLSNCATWICLGINDTVTAELVTKRIGTTTVGVRSDMHAENEPLVYLGRRRHSSGEGKRELLEISEIFRLGKDNVLILFQNHNPIVANKLPHTLHPSSKFLCDDPLGPMPSFYDAEGRARRQAAELEFIAKYREQHQLSYETPLSEQVDDEKKYFWDAEWEEYNDQNNHPIKEQEDILPTVPAVPSVASESEKRVASKPPERAQKPKRKFPVTDPKPVIQPLPEPPRPIFQPPAQDKTPVLEQKKSPPRPKQAAAPPVPTSPTYPQAAKGSPVSITDILTASGGVAIERRKEITEADLNIIYYETPKLTASGRKPPGKAMKIT